MGIHTGRVTGGVVGVKKYIYDVFGDTVNTASRMESNSEPMRINVSDRTYEILRDKFEFENASRLKSKARVFFKCTSLTHRKMMPHLKKRMKILKKVHNKEGLSCVYV